jgi:hypothetical protein
LTGALCVSVPSEAEIVTVYVPAAVDEVVLTVSVDDEVGVLDAGLKLPVAPVGSPLTLHVTELP